MTRRYTQRARAEAAERTRGRIIAAARAAVLAEGPPAFSVGEIASAADVARSTIYATFASRSGLLAAVADDTLTRAGLAQVVAEYRRADAVEALERSLVASCRMYAAEHRAFRRLLVLAEVDPDAAEPLARSQRDRAAAMSDLARRLAEQRALSTGLTVERAADVLSLLTNFWTFDELHAGRRLDAEACANVLVGIARTSVLGRVEDAS
jgi:AcrR family transcriptional regulator